jgi:peptidoglycan/xylan/chitin deacetylase (PgdA/CDA1 family)
VTVLCYHSVDPAWQDRLAVPPGDFARQCEWLAANRRVLDLPDAVAAADRRGRLPAGATAITFDDGYRALHEHAFPVLRRLGLPATVFLVAKTLPGGTDVDWVTERPVPASLPTLTLDQVLEMQDGGVRFGSHSWAHADLTTLSEAECERDLRESREALEDHLGRPVPYLAYPKGRHDDKVRRAARRAGYTHAFALPERREAPGPHAVPRAGVYPGNGLAALRVKTWRHYVGARTSRAFPLAASVAARLRGAGR